MQAVGDPDVKFCKLHPTFGTGSRSISITRVRRMGCARTIAIRIAIAARARRATAIPRIQRHFRDLRRAGMGIGELINGIVGCAAKVHAQTITVKCAIRSFLHHPQGKVFKRKRLEAIFRYKLLFFLADDCDCGMFRGQR